MLEGLVANLLNRFLGMYVRNFDPKQLNVGIWSGDVKLKNLELRREALDQLHLPLNVIEGHLGQLTLSIPWSNLRGKPVRVNIEDVYILAAPKEDEEYNAEEEEKRAHALKIEKLDSVELLKERNSDGMSAEDQAKNQSFTASLVTAIVDNLQISVKNVHVRYEDSISAPGHPFAAGLTLSELSAVSTDEHWMPTFIQSTSGTTHKLATLGALAIYWDTDTTLLGSGKGSQTAEEQGIDRDDLFKKFHDMIAKKDDVSGVGSHQYILKPVTGRAGLEMDKSGKTDRPKIKARLLFNELGFVLDDHQYRDALMLVDLFHYFIRHQEYRKLQPAKPPKEDPRAWLKFAGNAVLDKIHDRNRRWSWSFFKERRDDRIQYINLFKKKKKDEKLTPDEVQALDALERKLTYEDLRFWRSLARTQLRKENVGVKPAQKQTWSSWIWGGKGQEEKHDDETQMTEEQRKELYSAIDFDEKSIIAEAVDMPKEAIKLQVDMSLREGSFTLKRDPHGRANEMLQLIFQGFDTKFLQRTDSMLAELSLETMRLIDGTTDGNLFTQMLHIKQESPVSDLDRVQELNDDETPKKVSGAKGIGEEQEDDGDEDEEVPDPFFALVFENNPLDGHADSALTVKLKGMEFVHNPKFVSEVVKFFKPPERHMESIGALMETAGATVEGIRQQTRAGLEYALEEHKTVDVKLDLQAPLIIIPDSVTESASICMIVDAGHISVRSDLIDKDTLQEIQSKQKQQYTEEDYTRLKQLMYDKFLVKLQSTQVLMGSSIEETKQQLEAHHDDRTLHIIDRINMDFTVETCIIPKAADLTKFRINGHLPVLHASVSDSKYKKLMKLLDVAIPKFDSDEPRKVTGDAVKNSSTAPRSKSIIDQDAAGRSRSKSFQFSAQKHELVMEEDGEHDHNDNFKEAKEDSKDQSQPNINQRNFEFNFTVDKLQGSLYRSDPEGKKPDELLVDLIAEHFDLEFYQRQFDMTAEVRLRTLTVEDHVEHNPTPEFRNLISSEDLSTNNKEDLFSLKFVKVNKDSPEFMTKYEGIATNIDAAMSTINLLVTRKTLLTLLDFVMITFTNPDAPQTQQAPDESNKEIQEQAPAQDSDKIRVKAQLKRIAIILNNDGIRLATLSLTSAEVGVFLTGKSMRVGAKLGNLTLIDDVNQGVPEESSLRQLVSIQGQELADFRYETYDSESDAYPGYDSSVYLRSGSIKVNFVTEPFRKIMEFAIKFGKMQAIFNAARQAAAQNAENIQERAGKMHFDLKINTPIVAFPRMVITDSPERDVMTAYLGELYASNEFLPLDDSENAQTANKLSAGVNNIRLTSKFNYADSKEEELELIDKVDLDFIITSADHRPGVKRPDTEIEGSMSNINLRVTEAQLKFILELSRSIPAAFAADPEVEVEEIKEELPSSTVKDVKAITDGSSGDAVKSEDQSQSPANLGPEIGSTDETWTKLDFVFKVGAIGLELISGNPDKPIEDIAAASLSKFSLNETNIKLRMVSDGSMESELLVQSFTITDTRTRDKNKFRKIMSLINTDVKQQFMASVSISGGKERNLIALLTIDSPRIILSLDYLFAIQGFVNAGLATDEPLQIGDEEEESIAGEESEVASVSTLTPENESTAQDAGEEQASMNISYRVNIVDAQFILIANPSITSSEAIVLNTKQVLVSQQHVMTLQVDKLGMFLCRMDRFEGNKLRILDDFSIQTSIDMRTQNKQASLISINVDIEPLVLRLALRDILLVQQIVNRASALSGGSDDKQMANEGPSKIDQVKAPSTKAKSAKPASSKPKAKTIATKKSTKTVATSAPENQASAVLKREEMKIHMEGIRVVLIGDLHELPLFDWSVKNFAVEVRDWSGAMTADTNLDTFINVYNFSKSAWEPLIEPWSLGFHMAKNIHPEKLSVELYSRKSMELTITSATIAIACKSFLYLSKEDDILSKPRGTDAPYRILNYTGFDINVWAHTENNEDGAAAKMQDGEEIPWRFEDPTITRETLSPEGATGVVGVKLEGSGFDSIERIPIQREGETLYNLKPRKDKVQHRLLVEVKLGTDNIKYITFRSPLQVENHTQIPVEVGIFSPEEGNLLKIEKIAPGEARPAPVGAAFFHSLVFRPGEGFGYTWSNERLYWKDLLKRPVRTITCQGDEGDQSPPFYFQMQSVFDKTDPLTAVYPYMRIRLSAPVEIQNLLPFDFKYRIYDKNTKKDWTNFLRKGGVSPVHVVQLSHLLLLSIDMQDTPFKQSDFGIINSSEKDSFQREKALVVKDENGLSLRLKLHYYNIPNSGGAFKLTVYSPYVILNRTGLELDIRSKAFLGATKSAAGQQATFVNTEGRARKPLPFMFSFPTDDTSNRAMVKIGDSGWSKPVSFDAIGSTTAVSLPAESGRAEMQCGLSIEEGEGKYKLTKVVTIAPRFVVKNKLGTDINIREPGSSDMITLKTGELHPLRYMKQSTGQQICLCWPGVNNNWSSPFSIENVGSVHVKISKAGERQKLIRIETLMEGATMFLHISQETKHWPFSMRNESDVEYVFWQANPNVDEDEEDRTSGWKPIRYRLPPRSIMPYAWDYPATKNKNLVISARGKERYVKLAEIGNLIPMKLPPTGEQQRQKVIDLNVVAEGPTQTLVISNYKPSKSLYRQKSGSATASTATGFEVKDLDAHVTLNAQIRFSGVGISLINQQLRELIYVTFRDIDLSYKDSPLYQTVSSTVKWIQIDNQLYGGIFPLLFYPSVVPKTGKEMEAHPIFKATITRVKDDSYGVMYIKYFTFLMQQMTIEIDEDFIFAMLDFSKIPVLQVQDKEGKLCDEELDIPEPQQEQSGQDIYFELLHLQPMQFDLSFVRTERINAEDTGSSSSNPFMFAVNVLTMSIGNVNDAPIRYNALLLENARVSVDTLVANIKNHYVQESLRQVHIVLGSADFLGNPVGLFNNISSGVADIFYEPYNGLVMTDRPQDLGIGIAKGASSFVKKSVFGFSDSMAKVTGSISKGLAAASMDKEFQDQRRMSRSRNRPKHALYGITSGGNAFASSLASGIGGLARHPLEGAEKEGIGGFAKGIGKGLLGLATKPALGAFDLASNMAEGVRNTTTVFDQEGLDRVRLTRYIGRDGIVRPYSQREALGQFWLKTLDDGKYFNEEYIAHLELQSGASGAPSQKSGRGSGRADTQVGTPRLIMLTYNGIMLVQTKKLAVEWEVLLKDIQTISKERTGMSIVCKGGNNGPFIPVGDEQSRNWLYKQVAVAVNAYNDRWNAKG